MRLKKWFYELSVEVVLLKFMTSRSETPSIMESKNGSRSGVIGAGTLGSAVIDHFVRQGCSEEICLVDCDILLPHNLSRHTLTC